MAQIKIIAGTFGWKHGTAYDLVKAGDPPIEVGDNLAFRLVDKGVAVYAAPFVEETTGLPEGVTGIPEYNAEMKGEELRKIGEMCGLNFKKGMSKADMIAALDKHIEENMVEGVEVGEDGEVTALDEEAPAEDEEAEEVSSPDEDAPEFDAAEAVQ